MSKKNNDQFIATVKVKMKELKLNNEELARKMGISPSTVGRYLNGEIGNMRRDNIESMAKALNINPSTLMGWEDIDDDKDTIIINRKISSFTKDQKQRLIKLIDAAFDENDGDI